MNPSMDYEYYSAQARRIPPKAEGVLWTRRIKLSLEDAHLPYYESGIKYSRARQYSKSIVQLKKCVLLNRRLKQGWQDLGRILVAAGRYDESIIIFKRVVKKARGLKVAHHALIKAIEKAGRLEETASIYEEISQGLYSLQSQRAFKSGIDQLLQIKKNEYALECYKKGIKLYPLLVRFRIEYAMFLDKEGFLQEALDQYDLVVKQNPSFAENSYRIPLLRYELMMVEEAIRDLKHVLKNMDVDHLYFDLVVMLYHFHESVMEIEPYKQRVESLLNSGSRRNAKNHLVEKIRVKLESETDEKVKSYLVKKIKALEFVLNWTK